MFTVISNMVQQFSVPHACIKGFRMDGHISGPYNDPGSATAFQISVECHHLSRYFCNALIQAQISGLEHLRNILSFRKSWIFKAVPLLLTCEKQKFCGDIPDIICI